MCGLVFFAEAARNQFFERVRLSVTDPEQFPTRHFLRAVPRPAAHLFTAVQAAGLVVLWVVKASSVAVLFPVFIALLVPVRLLLSGLFKPEHLALLDAEERPEEEAFRETD